MIAASDHSPTHMIPEFIQQDNTPVNLQPVSPSGKHSSLPGSIAKHFNNKKFDVIVQEFQHPMFSIGYRLLRFFKKISISIKEKEPGMRLEAVLSGALPVEDAENNAVQLQAGQYHLTDNSVMTGLFKKDSACRYFITHYSADLLNQAGITQVVQPSPIKPLTDEMHKLIQQVLNNPYEEKLRAFHYDNCVRELLLMHLSNDQPLPGELTDDDLAAIIEADAILQQDIKKHYDIPTLASKVGSNEFKLKNGFRKKFNMGPFERLTWHRMEYARLLLSKSNRTIDDIAASSGYGSRNSFISAFKKMFKLTPKQWKIKNRFADTS